jgi:hypothetical protein
MPQKIKASSSRIKPVSHQIFTSSYSTSYSYSCYSNGKTEETKVDLISKDGKHIEGQYQHRDSKNKLKTIKITEKNLKDIVKLLQ